MKYRCVVAHGGTAAGDVIEVPDGAAVSDYHFEPVAVAPATPAPGAGDATQAKPAPSQTLSAAPATPKAGA